MNTAEIIASGSELISGDRLNTNAQWLSQELVTLGITPRWHTTLADQMEDHVSALTIAHQRVDLVVMTGGLGPTQDDLTREAFAAVAGTELVLDSQLLKIIEEMFATRGVAMPPRNRVQAYTPKGARPIPNPVGTAPGIWLEVGKKLLIALPGVPREMRHMWKESVVPDLLDFLGTQEFVMSHKMNLFGLGESAVEEKVMDLTARNHVPEVGITASEAVISLRIVARHKEAAEAKKQVEATRVDILERLGSYIFSEGDRTPAQCLSDALATENLAFAIAEVGTKGLLAHRLLTALGDRCVARAVCVQNWLEWNRLYPETSPDQLEGTVRDFGQRQSCGAAILMCSNPLGDNVFRFDVAISTPSETFVKTYQSKGSPEEILSRAVNFATFQMLRALPRPTGRM